MSSRALSIVLFGLSATLLAARSGAVLPSAPELSSRLGWTLEEAVETAGLPEEMFSYRGDEPEEDNVVFYYPNYSYLFWFQGRVWQVRVDERWEGEIGGISMGMTREDIFGHWGAALDSGADSWTYALPERGYPVRIRLYFDHRDRLVDLYVFRSDW